LVKYVRWYEGKLNASLARGQGGFGADPFRQLANGSLVGATEFPGDWCPAPAVPGMYWSAVNASMPNSSDARRLGEIECGSIAPGYNTVADFPDRNLSSAFSYLKDRMSVFEMGAAIGQQLEGGAISPTLAQDFNQAFLRPVQGTCA
jgi:hypothetical protein